MTHELIKSHREEYNTSYIIYIYYGNFEMYSERDTHIKKNNNISNAALFNLGDTKQSISRE